MGIYQRESRHLKKMNKVFLFSVIFFTILTLNTDNAQAAKKKKKSKSKTTQLEKDTKMFDSKTLKCLVCKNVIDEFEAAIYKIDPKKVIDTGTYRVNEKGENKKKIIPYARSQMHLLELSEKICDNFEDYAQAKDRKSGKPTIIRLTTPEGNMNPKFGEVEIVPDDDLNTKLKFHCEGIVEDNDEQLLDLLADEKNSPTLKHK